MKTLPAPLSDIDLEVSGLAVRYRRANGPVMALMNRIGGSLENQMKLLPDSLRQQLEALTAAALSRAMDVAAYGARAPDMGPRGPMAMAMASGAAGGLGGIATSLAELPVTITIILHAIRQSAVANGFDPDAPGIRAECLAVFGAGTPLGSDDGLNTSFLGARLAVTGPALQSLIAKVAPRLAAALGPKLFAQSVPLLGAIAGAGLNAAYIRYYREIADIRFGLLRLSQHHGAETVLMAFQQATQPQAILKA
jgi:EcsC protein family